MTEISLSLNHHEPCSIIFETTSYIIRLWNFLKIRSRKGIFSKLYYLSIWLLSTQNGVDFNNFCFISKNYVPIMTVICPRCYYSYSNERKRTSLCSIASNVRHVEFLTSSWTLFWLNINRYWIREYCII